MRECICYWGSGKRKFIMLWAYYDGLTLDPDKAVKYYEVEEDRELRFHGEDHDDAIEEFNLAVKHATRKAVLK